MRHTTIAEDSALKFTKPEHFSYAAPVVNQRRLFLISKRATDILFSVAALPILMLLAFILFLANSAFNPGSVFFRQVRMGQDGKAFTIWKFRTMTEGGSGLRSADEPLEESRITPLGRLLRRTKLDELPNILNIIAGDMSLVGPRPDAFAHATQYIAGIPLYGNRLSARPGLTGLAQVRGGYADNPRAVQRKARYDSFYINNSSLLLDLYVIGLTVSVVLSGFGQR